MSEPYRVRANRWTRNSSGWIDKTFPDLESMARWFGGKLRGERRAKFRSLRVERFNGREWERVRFQPLPVAFLIDDAVIETLSWDELVELEDE